LERGKHLALINVPGIGNQARHRFAMPGDDDLLALLDTVEKRTEGIFGFEGTDFANRGIVGFHLS
jgi:hypothetical protein